MHMFHIIFQHNFSVRPTQTSLAACIFSWINDLYSLELLENDLSVRVIPGHPDDIGPEAHT